MKWDEFFEQLEEALKVPETLEEAIECVKRDPVCQATIEDQAFKQVVINILVADGIVTEKDFNAAVAKFKEMFTRTLAEQLLDRLQQNSRHSHEIKIEGLDEIDDDDWDDWPDDDKKLPQA